MSVKIRTNFSLTGEIEITVHDDLIEDEFILNTEKSKRVADKIAREHIDRKLKEKGIDAFDFNYTVKSAYDDDADLVNEISQEIDEEPPF